MLHYERSSWTATTVLPALCLEGNNSIDRRITFELMIEIRGLPVTWLRCSEICTPISYLLTRDLGTLKYRTQELWPICEREKGESEWPPFTFRDALQTVSGALELLFFVQDHQS